MYNQIGENMQSLEIQVQKQLNKIFTSLQATGLKEQIQEAKKDIDSDKIVQNLIKRYNCLAVNPYDYEFRNLRIELFNNTKFAHYQNLLNQESQLILEINQRLTKIVKKRNCHENN